MLSKEFLDNYYKRIEQITAHENSVINKKLLKNLKNMII